MNQYYVSQDTKAPTTNRLTILRVANLLFFLLTMAFNYLSQAMPLNRKTTGELSDQYPNLFTPAPLTFSIWGVIYLALLLFIGWQMWPMRNTRRAEQRNTAVSALGWNFVWLCLLNMGWLFCWHYELVTARVVVMLVTLGLLIRMNILIFRDLSHTADNRNFLDIPFGLYLGWISVATVANITAWLVGINWDGFGISEKIWTVMMIAVATLVALLAVYSWRNVPYAVAVIWALLGITIQQRAMFGSPFSLIILVAYGGMLLLLI
ncbi:MAG: tryptophan-rich sensory protein, partial [Saprospiraceae bacterium]|nr:tryptophan-rich sensory protein [Saprospiraceae bacterium]